MAPLPPLEVAPLDGFVHAVVLEEHQPQATERSCRRPAPGGGIGLEEGWGSERQCWDHVHSLFFGR